MREMPFIIVLNRPQDIVNTAGTVRAMMNMGLERLRLVRPEIYDRYRIAGIAHGAEPLLDRVELFDTLDAAIADAGHVIGTTSRRRTATYVWNHPREAAPELVSLARSLDTPIAIVFGPEDKGLSNEELDRCDRVIVVPTDPSHASLNLAQAVLLVAYELWLAAGQAAGLPSPKRRSSPASPAELQALFADARTALETVEFFKARNQTMVMRTLRAVLRRAELSSREASLLRAMMIEVRKYFERTSANG
jgi:TrmH family RNA methyltransferase